MVFRAEPFEGPRRTTFLENLALLDCSSQPFLAPGVIQSTAWKPSRRWNLKQQNSDCSLLVFTVARNPNESCSLTEGPASVSMQRLLCDRGEINGLRGFDNNPQAAAGIFTMTLEAATGVTAERLQHGFHFLPTV